MTDKDKWKEFFTQFGIEFSEQELMLVLETGFHAKVTGYAGFLFEIHFDKDGKFERVAIWE